jgi:DNA-binding NtrC family response regulator
MPQIAMRTGKPIRELSPAALTALYDYEYPGNVRELRNILERAMVLCHTERIDVAELPKAVASSHGGSSASPRNAEPPVSMETLGGSQAGASARRRLKPSERQLLSEAIGASPGGPRAASADLPDALEDRPEVRRLVQALDAHQWNRRKTARTLGISRSTLWRRMRDYGLG